MPTSRSSISRANGRSTTPSCSRCPGHTVSRPQGPGPAGAYAGARPVCHEGPALVPETRGWGRSVHAIQNLPPPRLQNIDQTMKPSSAPGRTQNGSTPHERGNPHVASRRGRGAAALGCVRRTGEGHPHLWARRAPGSCADRDKPADRAGGLHRAGRPVRVRQVHHPQAGDGPDQRVERLRVRGGPAGRRRAGAGRHGVPEPHAAAVAHAARQCDAAAEDRAAVPRSNIAPSARPSSATASRRCWRRSGLPASATNIPGSFPAE